MHHRPCVSIMVLPVTDPMADTRLLSNARQRWRIFPAVVRKKTLVRLGRIFVAYVVIVFVLENVQLFYKYGETLPNIRFDLVGYQVPNMTGELLEANCTLNDSDCYDEDDEHHPANRIDPSLLDRHGRRYTFQSLPVNDAEKAYYRFRKDKVHPFMHKYLIESPNVCDERTTMIALVNSRPSNVVRRTAIRQTWGSVAHNGSWPHSRVIKGEVRLAFVFGVQQGWNDKLKAESVQHKDVIQGDFIDAYRNMTLKSLLGMKWIVDHCSGVSYYLKSDDDMVINIPFMLDILTGKLGLRRTIMGPLATSSRVYRSGKWSLNKKVYPFNTYPPYEPGAAYVMTADIVGELFQAAEYFPQIFIDDVYITGILARALGVNHARQYGFAFWGTKPPGVCAILLDKVITGHKVFDAKLIDMWNEMHRYTPALCKAGKSPPPVTKRKPAMNRKEKAKKKDPQPKGKSESIKEVNAKKEKGEEKKNNAKNQVKKIDDKTKVQMKNEVTKGKVDDVKNKVLKKEKKQTKEQKKEPVKVTKKVDKEKGEVHKWKKLDNETKVKTKDGVTIVVKLEPTKNMMPKHEGGETKGLKKELVKEIKKEKGKRKNT